MDSNQVLSLNKISKQYDKTKVVLDMTFTVDKGHIVALIGENGAGKTTLLRIISGLTTQTNGTLSLFGRSATTDIIKMRKRVGVLIEAPGFFPNLTGYENLKYYSIMKGCTEEINHILETVGLKSAAHKKYRNYSLGMKQRLGIGLSLLGNPELLLLDEPINGLDPTGIIDVRNLICNACREHGITVLLSSHILSEIENMADEYIFIHKGRLVKQVSKSDTTAWHNESIRLETDNNTEALKLLHDKYGNKSAVNNDGIIYIGDENAFSTDISRLIVESGIGLISISRHRTSLESYYSDTIGDDVHDKLSEK